MKLHYLQIKEARNSPIDFMKFIEENISSTIDLKHLLASF